MTEEQERAAFEAWRRRTTNMVDKDGSVAREGFGDDADYEHRGTRSMWIGWQARASLAKPQPVEPVAWLAESGEATIFKTIADGWKRHGGKVTPLYTRTQPVVGALTDDAGIISRARFVVRGRYGSDAVAVDVGLICELIELATRATLSAPVAQPAKCLMCNGHGMIGGFVSDGDGGGGYDSEPCPECNPPAAQPGEDLRELLREARDNAIASTSEEDISADRRTYRRELAERLNAARNALATPIAAQPAAAEEPVTSPERRLPEQRAEFYCNKCGYVGPTQYPHKKPNHCSECNYMASPIAAPAQPAAAEPVAYLDPSERDASDAFSWRRTKRHTVAVHTGEQA